MSATPRVEPYTIAIAQDILDDLHARLARTRFPQAVGDDDEWQMGVPPTYAAELVDYWQNQFDWRAQEAMLNRLSHFRTEISGLAIHFVHERGKGPAPMPLLLTHGWPDSFTRFLKIIPLLTDPAAHGGDARDAFDVVVPSIPGYGFSDRPLKSGVLQSIPDLWNTLMTERLGYEKYGAQGGDWGSTITEMLAQQHAKSLVGIHLTDVPTGHAVEPPPNLSPTEQKYVAKVMKWRETEGGYMAEQGTRPQTLAYGLADSPAGLAAWLTEKYRQWSDCDGDVETRFTKDDLLTNITIYWATETVRSSFQLYYDRMHASLLERASTKLKEITKSKPDVPVAIASFPKDLNPPPREWAERFFDVHRFTEMTSGGHFPAFEEPEALAEDVRAFFRPLRGLQSP